MQSVSTLEYVVRRDDMTALGDYAAPEDHIEIDLSLMMSRLLGYDCIGLHDDYFALGGTSAQALELFDYINNRYKLEVPVSTLIVYSTVGKLSAIVREGLNTVVREGLTESYADNNLPVCMASGPKPYLFIVPGLEGDPIGLEEFAGEVRGKFGVYGLQLQGVYSNSRPSKDLKQIAAHCVSAMKNIDPDGPYHILGKCAGSIVALEIARQLHEAGQSIVQVVMMNPPWIYSGGRFRSGSLDSRLRKLRRSARNKFLLGCELPFQNYVSSLFPLMDNFFDQPLRMWVGYHRKKERMNPYIAKRRRVIHCFKKAVRNYELQLYQFPLLLIGMPEKYDSQDVNWLSFLGDKIQYIRFAGNDTLDFVRGENAKELVKLLQDRAETYQ
ncbi:MAG: thioesterase domain-containing protein [Pseudomonadota bacterium]|nr:thioesterase domain-containing protein [Pseudomonadota bacterium]